jgi:hypothetical protein
LTEAASKPTTSRTHYELRIRVLEEEPQLETRRSEQLSHFWRTSVLDGFVCVSPPEVMDLFRKYQEFQKGVFAIKSNRPPLPAKPQQYYRCESIFHELTEWLREHGVNGTKPVLEKGIWFLLTRTYGIHAASRALRHADLRTTSEHYSDVTAGALPGIGRFLAQKPKRRKTEGLAIRKSKRT